jgi:amidase
MAIRSPTAAEIEEIAGDLGLHLDAEDVASFRNLVEPFVLSTAIFDGIADEFPPVRYPRSPGERPAPEDNPLGAWYVKTRVEGASHGKLAGRSVALKDNVMLAGVPMMSGTTLLEGYVPPVDATIVTRILDAGGTIVGKAVCESFCLSGGSHTSETGPVRNPHDPSRHAGGSSSGSAALVAAGEVDLAIGGDQGGSIRVPSSFCGTVGMKPTHGLVPYTGILSLEPTIDHAGPITANVADNALLLEVIAGGDGIDGRQKAPRVDPYSEALGQGVEGLRMALLLEGLGHRDSEPDVEQKVRAAADRFTRLGAKVTDVSVPMHRVAGVLMAPIYQAAMIQVLETDGMGVGREDLYVASLADRMSGWRERVDQLPDTVKTMLIGMEVLRRRYGWRYFAKAMNEVRRVRAAYDAALQDVDILLLPTTPMKAPPLPPSGATREAIVEAAFAPVSNTQPFDHTHHPALSIPCGRSQELPVGLMLVGRAWEEATLYRAADALERSGDWREW